MKNKRKSKNEEVEQLSSPIYRLMLFYGGISFQTSVLHLHSERKIL